MADRKTILLIEDEPLLANLLKQRLEREGFSVTIARDGEEGMKSLSENVYDLLLLDIILPKMSGFELMEKMREDPHVGKTPVIIISNLGQESDVARGESLGAVAYFVKAKVSIDELIDEVKKFLASRA